MKRFALIGSAGYIAPRHMKAIKTTGNDLVCMLDPYDGMGIVDSYFPNADFFTETERFDKHLDRLRRSGNGVDYVSICSPNYLHDSHIRMALRNGSDVICEKPLVINPKNIKEIEQIEKETGKNVYTILQLRLHPSVIDLKKTVDKDPHKIYDIDLIYVTPRGKWYNYSWKGDERKSGGIIMNIGIHFFDMLGWIFGEYIHSDVDFRFFNKAKGKTYFEKANVNWFLSIDENDIPSGHGQRTFKKINIEGKTFEFSSGFEDLHTLSYERILQGKGFGIKDAITSIEIVSRL